MKRLLFILGLIICATFVVTDADAQVKYENNAFKIPTLYSTRVFVSLDAANYMTHTMQNATGAILGIEAVGRRNPSVPGSGPASFVGPFMPVTISWPAFNAQSVQSSILGSTSVDESGKISVDYNAVLVVLVKAFQEQQAEIETLKQRIAILENQ